MPWQDYGCLHSGGKYGGVCWINPISAKGNNDLSLENDVDQYCVSTKIKPHSLGQRRNCIK